MKASYQRGSSLCEEFSDFVLYDDDFDRAPDSKLKALINWMREHLQDNGNWNVFKKTSAGSVPKQYSKDATSKRNTNTNRAPTKLSSARNDKNSRR